MTSDNHSDTDPGDGRDESPSERSDRSWNEILQQLRVIQTGTGVLTGCLLCLAFPPPFADLGALAVAIHLPLVIVAVLALPQIWVVVIAWLVTPARVRVGHAVG